MQQRPYRHRRDSIYLLILGACLLVTVIGVAAVAATRIQARTALIGGDIFQARMHARSAVDTAKHHGLGSSPRDVIENRVAPDFRVVKETAKKRDQRKLEPTGTL